MSDAYTVFWTQEYCRWLKRAGDLGTPLEVVFGGPHQSWPSLTRYGVQVGDDVYPISVKQGQLYLIARMRVRAFVPVEDYLTPFLPLLGDTPPTHHWDAYARLHQVCPTLGHRVPSPHSCIDHAALGEQGWPIRLDRPFPDPPDTIRYRSRRAERGLKHIVDGRITYSVCLQGGVYRLSEATAARFAQCEESGLTHSDGLPA
jgi:hypothetical protein